jgi:hypothetical protein
MTSTETVMSLALVLPVVALLLVVLMALGVFGMLHRRRGRAVQS